MNSRVGTAFARVGIAFLIMAASVVSLGAPAGAATAWRVVPTAPGTLYGHLNSVSCPTPTTCVAVGVQDTAKGVFRMIERWNGKKWAVMPAPNPSGAISSSLTSVHCRTTSSCVAVGQYNTLTATRTLILNWNGKVWTKQVSPNAPNSALSTLAGVHCASARLCFAVGSSYLGSETSSAQLTLIEKYDGKKWTIVPSPNQPFAFDSGLSAVACPSVTTCYAVGSYEVQNLTNTLIEYFDGSTWTIVPSPNAPNTVFNDLSGIACTSTVSCFAVGSGHGSLVQRLIGTTWSIVPSPNPTGATAVALTGVSCPSANRCFAVGDQLKKHVFHRLVEMWNGAKWSVVGVPVPSGTKKSSLSGVACANPVNCFAVGDFRLGKSRRPLLERYS